MIGSSDGVLKMRHIIFMFNKRRKNSLLAEQLSAVKASAYKLVIGRMCNVHKTLIRELQLTNTYGDTEAF
jgi:hypothetical protein